MYSTIRMCLCMYVRPDERDEASRGCEDGEWKAGEKEMTTEARAERGLFICMTGGEGTGWGLVRNRGGSLPGYKSKRGGWLVGTWDGTPARGAKKKRRSDIQIPEWALYLPPPVAYCPAVFGRLGRRRSR